MDLESNQGRWSAAGELSGLICWWGSFQRGLKSLKCNMLESRQSGAIRDIEFNSGNPGQVGLAGASGSAQQGQYQVGVEEKVSLPRGRDTGRSRSLDVCSLKFSVWKRNLFGKMLCSSCPGR